MRKLTEEEFEDICSVIELDGTTPFDVAISVYEHTVEELKKQLNDIKIYPENIKLLKEKIKKQYFYSKAQPGEMIGCIAASSIGEQNTQASLNSFHSAGIMKANLTDGISRLDELISANKKIKTPSCTFYFNNISNTELYQVKRLSNMYILYHDIMACIDKYNIHYQYKFTDYELKYLNFYKKFYKSVEITDWSVRMYFEKTKLYNINKTIEEICKIINNNFTNLHCIFYPENKLYIDIFISNNIPNPSEIMKKGYSYNIEYEEKSDKNKMKKEKEHSEMNYEDYDDIEDETHIENKDEEEENNKYEEENNKYEDLVNDDNKMYFYIKDVVIPSILVLQLSGIKEIKECYFSEDTKGKWFVQTKGSNLRELLNVDIIDYKTSISNNMNEVFSILGIEATKQFITDEFYKIINVSKRHLQMLVSAMTFYGIISPVSRYGMNQTSGILTKISFEQPFDNLVNSACLGTIDNIKGVSSSICIGKLGRFGTGMIDVIEDKTKKSDIVIEKNDINIENYIKPKPENKNIEKSKKLIVKTIKTNVVEKNNVMSSLEINKNIIKKYINNSYNENELIV